MRKYKYKIDRSCFNGLDEVLLDKMNIEKLVLMPYLQLEDGKNVLLKTLTILYSDYNSDYTIFKAKPGKFKTNKQQEKDGLNYSPFESKAFTVLEYINSTNDYNWIGIHFRDFFLDEEVFSLWYKFYEDNFEELKFNYLKTT